MTNNIFNVFKGSSIFPQEKGNRVAEAEVYSVYLIEKVQKYNKFLKQRPMPKLSNQQVCKIYMNLQSIRKIILSLISDYLKSLNERLKKEHITVEAGDDYIGKNISDYYPYDMIGESVIGSLDYAFHEAYGADHLFITIAKPSDYNINYLKIKKGDKCLYEHRAETSLAPAQDVPVDTITLSNYISHILFYLD